MYWGPRYDKFNPCVSMLRDMPRVASHGRAFRVEFLDQVAQRYVQYSDASGSGFGCVRAIEATLGVPRVKQLGFVFGSGERFF